MAKPPIHHFIPTTLEDCIAQEWPHAELDIEDASTYEEYVALYPRDYLDRIPDDAKQMDRGLIFHLTMPAQCRFELPDEYTAIPEAANPTCPFCQKAFVSFLDLIDHLRLQTCPNIFEDEITYFWKAGKNIRILESTN